MFILLILDQPEASDLLRNHLYPLANNKMLEDLRYLYLTRPPLLPWSLSMAYPNYGYEFCLFYKNTTIFDSLLYIADT